MQEKKVPLLCRFGGNLHWNSGEVHYKGGENRILRVDRAINYPNLLCKVKETCKCHVVNSMKYMRPGLGLDALVSIKNNDDIQRMMQAFPEGSKVIQLFVSCSPSAAIMAPRKVGNNGAPKATSSDIHRSNHRLMPLPNDATLCSIDLQNPENDIHEVHDALSDHQESVGEVTDDIGRYNNRPHLRVEDISHKACREYSMSGSSKKERLASSHLVNILTPKMKSFKPNHNHKHKKAVLKDLDYRTSALDLLKAQQQKHSDDILKGYHKEADHEIKESCDNLLTYCQEICRSNPGSVVTLNQTADGSLRVFLAYGAAIHGFIRACRQLLLLKSFHIKGEFPCTWLFAVGLDPNNNAFPFACAIVKSNDQENWEWFCVQLADILKTEHKMTFVWDRQEKHLQAIYDIFPNSYCRYLREPLIDDFSENFGCLDSDLLPLFHQATYAYTQSEFNALMSEICRISREARKWIDRLEPKQWARSHLEGEDYDGYDDFEWEFDTWIRTAQDLSMVSMLERFHNFMMDLFRNRHLERSSWKTTMTPFVEEFRFKRDFMPVLRNDKHTADLIQRKCSCCEWQVRKIPCTHAVVAILIRGLNAFEYCDMCYAVLTYEKAYSEAIHPCSRTSPMMLTHGTPDWQ